MIETDESEYDQKMDEIIDQLQILILNSIIDALEKLNERNEDQMMHQTTITYV